MIDFSQFHFLRPLWLLALLPLVMILWLLAVRKLGSRSWETVCDAELLPFILTGRTTRSRRWSIGLIGTCGLLAVLALAGPVWERLPQPVFQRQSALVIALDLSRSMEATDIKPNRMERARFKIADLLNLRREGQTALLVYAGAAFVVTPLTRDTRTIASQLPVLSTALMPAQGSDSGRALGKAGELLQQGGISGGHILLVTDEVEVPENDPTLGQLRKQGYRLSILGVGTGEGSPVPLPEGGFLKDGAGSIVIATLDSQALRSVTRSGGGIYREIQTDDTDIDALSAFFAKDPVTGEGATTEFATDVWKEQGPWLVLVLLPLAALSFRRGYLVLVLSLLLPYPQPARAFEWPALWLNADQQAMRALNAGESARAAQLFADPAWKAAAQYRAGDFAAAGKTLDNMDDAEGNYNKGNALARQGHYEEAIAAYDRTLALMPEHGDARFNRELVAKELQQQQQDQQQQEQQQQSPSSSEKKEEGQGPSPEQPQPQQPQGDGGSSQPQSPQEKEAGDIQDQSGADQQQAEANKQSTADSKAAEKEGEQDKQNDADQSVSQSAGQDEGKEDSKSVATSENELPDEETQAEEQWLRRIPDDPGGLLRRKFQYQYQRQARQSTMDGKTW